MTPATVATEPSAPQPKPVGSGAAEAAKAWRSSLPSERRRSTVYRGGLTFAISAALYIAFFVGAFLAPNWWLRFFCFANIPGVIGALFVIGHDSAHHSLTPSYILNRILGRLAMMPGYHTYTSWCHAHNTLHHGGTCLKQKHPDFPPMSKAEYDAAPAWRRAVERVYRHPLGVGFCYLFDFWAKYLIFPKPENRSPYRFWFELDRLLVAGFFVFQVWIGYVLTGHMNDSFFPRWAYALFMATAPWAIWLYFMGVASFVQHTHPRTAWYDDPEEWSFYHVQLRSSTHMVLPWVIGRSLHNIMDHPAHHIDPTIPLYELPQSQKLLEEQTPEHSVVVKLTVGEYFRICRLCKLYDYRRHCWTDFDGNPTTETGLHGLGLKEPAAAPVGA